MSIYLPEPTYHTECSVRDVWYRDYTTRYADYDVYTARNTKRNI